MDDEIKIVLQSTQRILEEAGVDKSYGPTAFEIVFSILWGEPTGVDNNDQPSRVRTDAGNQETISKIANFTGLDTSKLKDVFYQDDSGEIRLRNIPLDLVGKNRRQKQKGIASVFLLARKLDGREKVSGLEMAQLMKDRGILDGNLNMITRGSDRVATAEGKGRGVYYQLSSSGEKTAKSVIEKIIDMEE